jgi:hypothetical protein
MISWTNLRMPILAMDGFEVVILYSYYVGVAFTYALFFPKRIFTNEYVTLLLTYLLGYEMANYCKENLLLKIPMEMMGMYILFDFYLMIQRLQAMKNR